MLNEPACRPGTFSGKRPLFGGARRPAGGALSRFLGTGAHALRDHAALPADHPAVTEGRTLFPSRVFAAGDVPRLLVGGHNAAKIGAVIVKGPWAGLPVVTLTLEERATCPSSCTLWRECYGNAMPLARRVRVGSDFSVRLGAELRALAAAHPRGFALRLHVLGDVPDMDYLRHWVRWMAEIPQLHVWGYTAHRRSSPIGGIIAEANEFWPGRWVVRFSVPAGERPGQHQATTIWRQPEAGVVAEGIVCPAQTGGTQACATCGLCWAPAAAGKRIVFIGHGMRRRGGKGGEMADKEPGAAAPATGDALALVARMVEQAAEARAAELLAQRLASALEAAREQAWMEGFLQGQEEEREAWRGRMRALLGAEDRDAWAGVAAGAPAGRPPTEAGGIAPAKAAEEEADAEAGVPTGAPAAEATAPQPIGRPPNTGGGPPAPPEPPQQQREAAPAAAEGWQDWRTPAREARLRELWNIAAYSQREIWEDLKLVEGPTMPSDSANLAHWSRKLNLPPRPARQHVQPAASNVQRGVVAALQRADAAAPESLPVRPPIAARPGPPALPKPSAGKVYASYREIKEWAAHYGITFDGSNVHVVNAKRKALLLAPVVVDEDRTAADTRAA